MHSEVTVIPPASGNVSRKGRSRTARMTKKQARGRQQARLQPIPEDLSECNISESPQGQILQEVCQPSDLKHIGFDFNPNNHLRYVGSLQNIEESKVTLRSAAKPAPLRRGVRKAKKDNVAAAVPCTRSTRSRTRMQQNAPAVDTSGQPNEQETELSKTPNGEPGRGSCAGKRSTDVPQPATSERKNEMDPNEMHTPRIISGNAEIFEATQEGSDAPGQVPTTFAAVGCKSSRKRQRTGGSPERHARSLKKRHSGAADEEDTSDAQPSPSASMSLQTSTASPHCDIAFPAVQSQDLLDDGVTPVKIGFQNNTQAACKSADRFGPATRRATVERKSGAPEVNSCGHLTPLWRPSTRKPSTLFKVHLLFGKIHKLKYYNGACMLLGQWSGGVYVQPARS